MRQSQVRVPHPPTHTHSLLLFKMAGVGQFKGLLRGPNGIKHIESFTCAAIFKIGDSRHL